MNVTAAILAPVLLAVAALLAATAWAGPRPYNLAALGMLLAGFLWLFT